MEGAALHKVPSVEGHHSALPRPVVQTAASRARPEQVSPAVVAGGAVACAPGWWQDLGEPPEQVVGQAQAEPAAAGAVAPAPEQQKALEQPSRQAVELEQAGAAGLALPRWQQRPEQARKQTQVVLVLDPSQEQERLVVPGRGLPGDAPCFALFGATCLRPSTPRISTESHASSKPEAIRPRLRGLLEGIGYFQTKPPKQLNTFLQPENFILIGFSSFPDLVAPLFVVFSIMYLAILAGNIIIVTTIRLESALHIPMYFFLCALSRSEVCYTFTIVPNMLVNLFFLKPSISFVGCATQMFLFLGFGSTNCMLLTWMGYDRYVSICKPLHYAVLMNQRFCTKLVVFSATSGFLVSTLYTYFIFTLPFCGPNVIHHFFCDLAPLLVLACGRNYVGEIIIFLLCFLVVFCSFLLILLLYLLILNTILKIPTTEGKRKAFSTCASHLIAVVVPFGCASVIYLRPQSRYTLNADTFISVTYTLVTPLLNPVVYSLRNKDVQIALKKYWGGRTCMRKV
ncbi:olfactory receptor 10T2-like [Sphaerodactylus townsendi]|uniref:olfactory receptor 10T2-like n=1 Tax=Sphaerodactylus townsendi TaxID=933632 RepID=UPI002025FB77|nr:olfactory receptor 10T2-like [Sphaerodactylus townsendi]